MNARKNKKVLIALSSVMALGTLGAVLAFSRGEEGLSRASTGVSSSIVFSREGGEFTKIDGKTASISGTSFTGAKYYAVSHNIGDISDTEYVAQFGSGVATDEQYVSFSTSPTGTDDFEFEGITGVKVWTTSGSSQTMYLRYSDDGSSFFNFETISGSTNPEKYSFKTSYKFVRLVGYSASVRNVTKIELFYDCGVEPGPEKQVTLIGVSGQKIVYAQGSNFVEPTVTAYYSDSTYEVVEGAVFSGFDSSSLTESQTIMVNYGGKSTSYNIKVRPAETSKLISYYGVNSATYEDLELSDFINLNSSVLPAYAEPSSSVTLTPICINDYNIVYVDEAEELVTPEDLGNGSYSFIMVDADISINFYASIPAAITGIRVDNPKTTYYVDDEFVEPEVYAVYDNYSESLIPSDELSFSGFDSSSAIASQTIVVEYQEFNANYSIEILEKGGDAKELLNGAYTAPQSSNTMRLSFDGNGNGSYTYINAFATEKYIINFTYDVDEGTKEVTITLDSNTAKSNITGYANGYRIVNPNLDPSAWINNSGVINSNGFLSIRLWRVSAGTYSQDETPVNFSKQ